MDRNQEIALTQLRKSVEKLGSSTESYGEKTLMRFLIARSMDPEKAAKMFCQWKKWRAEMVPLGYIPDSEVADELAAEKVYLQGLSKNGRPLMIVKVSKHFPSKDQVQFKSNFFSLRVKAYYPERLATCYLLHMPQFFVSVWRFICRFLEKATQEKIRIVTSEEQKEEFIREVGEDVLPEEYGGRAKLVTLQDVAVDY